ncbi:hypothetical protein ABZV65_19415 [Streptomyces bauhiniae]|uniref:hypothetical protein n=1 Tax=Streptomyces bauhiniae TaxID=2340725 RepID=UPI0033B73A62
MARLQILQLPEGPGDDRPPFALVIDQARLTDFYPSTEGKSVLQVAQERLSTEDPLDGMADRLGARAVLVFEDTISIPANDTSGYLNSRQAADAMVRVQIEGDAEEAVRRGVEYATRQYGADATNVRDQDAELRAANEWIERLASERDEARQWARHGYKIGQRHCGWTDHGVAPAWLTDGWPPHIDSCEHLKEAAVYDEALTRVRAEVARIRATTRTWEPVADLIEAALNGTQRPGERVDYGQGHVNEPSEPNA